MGIRIRIIEKETSSLVFEAEGVDFSVLDSLQETLNEMEEVEYSGTTLLHPLHPSLRFVLRVKPGHNAQDILLRGLERLQGVAETLHALIERLNEQVRKASETTQTAS
ncbi:MAG: hypothetical protein NZ988_01825 [Thaumarchaeota archaeon]|nr:hypothetical protein [Candidatus Calditenuaceae archaeon]MDW8186774.1 RpoL/Rpb11 RNA polymerase subunit family protein [Nitrososphaerota archaeon]